MIIYHYRPCPGVVVPILKAIGAVEQKGSGGIASIVIYVAMAISYNNSDGPNDSDMKYESYQPYQQPWLKYGVVWTNHVPRCTENVVGLIITDYFPCPLVSSLLYLCLQAHSGSDG